MVRSLLKGDCYVNEPPLAGRQWDCYFRPIRFRPGLRRTSDTKRLQRSLFLFGDCLRGNLCSEAVE